MIAWICFFFLRDILARAVTLNFLLALCSANVNERDCVCGSVPELLASTPNVTQAACPES